MDWLSQKEIFGKEIIKLLYKNKMILTWYRDNPDGWKLVSGMWSPFYIQLRELIAFPDILKKVGSYLSEVIKNEIPKADIVIGLAMAGIPIATAISIEGNIPSAFTRKVEGDINSFEEMIHRYGKHSLIEGRLCDNQNVVLVDDLVSYFSSKVQGINLVKYEAERRTLKNIDVNHIAVLLDREQGGEVEAKKHNVTLHSLIPFKSKGIDWLKDDFSEVEYRVITDYLNNPEKYQQKELQDEIKQHI